MRFAQDDNRNKQPQVLRLRLAQNAPDFAQDDNLLGLCEREALPAGALFGLHLLHHGLLGLDAAAGAHGFEHFSHLGVLAEEVVDFLDGGSGAAGDALAAATVDDLVVAALLGGYSHDSTGALGNLDDLWSYTPLLDIQSSRSCALARPRSEAMPSINHDIYPYISSSTNFFATSGAMYSSRSISGPASSTGSVSSSVGTPVFS